MGRSKGKYCSAINCRNNWKDCQLSLFSFPKDPERCKKWVVNTRRQDLLRKDVSYLNVNCQLCSLHFEDLQFMNAKEKKKLLWNAIPTIFNILNPPQQLNLNSDRCVRAQKRSSKPFTQPSSREKTSVATEENLSSVDIDDVGNSHCSATDPELVDFGCQTDFATVMKEASLNERLCKLKKDIKVLQQKKSRLKKSLPVDGKQSSTNTTPKQELQNALNVLKKYVPDAQYQLLETQVRMSLQKNYGKNET